MLSSWVHAWCWSWLQLYQCSFEIKNLRYKKFHDYILYGLLIFYHTLSFSQSAIGLTSSLKIINIKYKLIIHFLLSIKLFLSLCHLLNYWNALVRENNNSKRVWKITKTKARNNISHVLLIDHGGLELGEIEIIAENCLIEVTAVLDKLGELIDGELDSGTRLHEILRKILLEIIRDL